MATKGEPATSILGGMGKRDGFKARIIKGSEGRPVLQCLEASSVIQLELTGRPDGIRPGGFESTLDMLQAHVQDTCGNARVSPQQWMELDREFTQYQQRGKAALAAVMESPYRDDPTTARRLCEIVAADARHCLDTIEFAARAHPAGCLSMARPELQPAILAQMYAVHAQRHVLEHDFAAALTCIETGLNQVCTLLERGGESTAENVYVQGLRRLERDIREKGASARPAVSDTVDGGSASDMEGATPGPLRPRLERMVSAEH